MCVCVYVCVCVEGGRWGGKERGRGEREGGGRGERGEGEKEGVKGREVSQAATNAHYIHYLSPPLNSFMIASLSF